MINKLIVVLGYGFGMVLMVGIVVAIGIVLPVAVTSYFKISNESSKIILFIWFIFLIGALIGWNGDE